MHPQGVRPARCQVLVDKYWDKFARRGHYCSCLLEEVAAWIHLLTQLVLRICSFASGRQSEGAARVTLSRNPETLSANYL